MKKILKIIGWTYLVFFLLGVVKLFIEESSRGRAPHTERVENTPETPREDIGNAAVSLSIADIAHNYYFNNHQLIVATDSMVYLNDGALKIYHLTAIEGTHASLQGLATFTRTGNGSSMMALQPEPPTDMTVGFSRLVKKRSVKWHAFVETPKGKKTDFREGDGINLPSEYLLLAQLYKLDDDIPLERLRMNKSNDGKVAKFFLSDSITEGYTAFGSKEDVRTALSQYLVDVSDRYIFDWDETNRRRAQFAHDGNWINGWKAGPYVSFILLGMGLLMLLSLAMNSGGRLCEKRYRLRNYTYRFTSYGKWIMILGICLLSSSIWYFTSMGLYSFWFFGLKGTLSLFGWFFGIIGVTAYFVLAMLTEQALELAVETRGQIDTPKYGIVESIFGYGLVAYIAFYIIRLYVSGIGDISREQILMAYGLFMAICLPRNIIRLLECDADGRLVAFIVFFFFYPLRYPLFFFGAISRAFINMLPNIGYLGDGDDFTSVKVVGYDGKIHELYKNPGGTWSDAEDAFGGIWVNHGDHFSCDGTGHYKILR